MCYEIKFAFTCPSDAMTHANGKPVKNVSGSATSQEYCAVVSISILKEIFCGDYLESFLKGSCWVQWNRKTLQESPKQSQFLQKVKNGQQPNQLELRFLIHL